MLRRFNLWMADWRDAAGKRHRKGFATKTQATLYQEKQQRLTAAKKTHPSAPSPRSVTRGPRGKNSSTRASSHATSKPSRARSARTN